MKDKMKDIYQKFAIKVEKNINSLVFLYGGNQLNFDLRTKKSTFDNVQNWYTDLTGKIFGGLIKNYPNQAKNKIEISIEIKLLSKKKIDNCFIKPSNEKKFIIPKTNNGKNQVQINNNIQQGNVNNISI